MFDIGMGEIALIAVIALLVLGPERLPGTARTAGALLRKARSSWQNVRNEIERELAAEELQRQLKQTVGKANSLTDPLIATNNILSSSTPPTAKTASEPHERS